MSSDTSPPVGPAASAQEHPFNLPYFDLILGLLEQGAPDMQTAFGHHVHWGIWDDPASFDGTPESYARAAERLSQSILDIAQVRSGQAILDTGCGLGGTNASINERVSDATIVGLNIDPRQLAVARQKAQPRSGNTIEFVHGDACKLPFPDASFDVVLAVECIFHFPSREDFFAHVRRVLKPGGRLVLSDYTPANLMAPAIPWIFRKYGAELLATYGTLDYTCSPDRYRELARRHGFSEPAFRDINREHLPSLRFLMERLVGWLGQENAKGGVTALTVLERLCKLRILRYQIVSFVRR
jgi:ubiquinone/menaquinone biosynthesis C-methylase UbiE